MKSGRLRWGGWIDEVNALAAGAHLHDSGFKLGIVPPSGVDSPVYSEPSAPGDILKPAHLAAPILARNNLRLFVGAQVPKP